MDCSDCRNELNLKKLCVKKESVKCLCACKVMAKELCADDLKAKSFMVESEVANTICAQKVCAKEVDALYTTTDRLCSQEGTINKLCVNEITVGKLNYCAKWRAAVTISSPMVYTLGSNIDWNVVLDDPNGNVSMGPFSYTVPVTGYYTMTYYTNSNALAGSIVIAGIPVSLLTVTSNGSELRQFNAPYLAFSDQQYASLSAVVLLNAGDVIRMKYDVIVLSPVSGQMNYVGTINLNGNGLFPNSSGFEIHYLSSLDCQPVTCMPCAPAQVPCEPITIQCDKNQDCFPHCPIDKDPCAPCNPSDM